MPETQWTAVDVFISEHLVPEDSALTLAVKDSEAAGLPSIQVAPNCGKLLNLLAKIHGAKRILEIGTLGGYSTIWLARALPEDGRLITLEYNPKHAEVARQNIDRAGIGDRVEIRVGAALDNLPPLESQGLAPFDLIFIDADKVNTPHYLEWAVKLGRVGTVIIVDNVVRGGAIVGEEHKDEHVQGIIETYKLLQSNSRLDATALQTVGSKGYDGFAIALITH